MQNDCKSRLIYIFVKSTISSFFNIKIEQRRNRTFYSTEILFILSINIYKDFDLILMT